MIAHEPSAVRQPTADPFVHAEAFSRNCGWLTQAEQGVLRQKRIAIAGMGGVGGNHLMTLARLGVGAFHIADFDCFELANFNRQAGAFMSTLGKPKVEVMARLALEINPELRLKCFTKGVQAQNAAEFLDGVDLFVDGLDAFEIETRRMIYAECAERRIPALAAGPLGMGAAWMTFLPGKMTFDEYFGVRGVPPDEQILRYLVGMAPAALHREYLVDRSAVDLPNRRGPSTPMACMICAGVAATEALKILLGRKRVYAAPHGFQFDAYTKKIIHTWRPWGYRHPLQRMTLALCRRFFELRPP